MRTAAPLVIGLIITLSGCASTPQVDYGPRTIEASEPSAACAEAGDRAALGVDSIHSYENSRWDEANADGELTDEERESLLAMETQAEEDYSRVIAPTFTECTTAGEWLGLVRNSPEIVELTMSVAVTDWTLENFCPSFADTPVCIDAANQGIVFEPAAK